MPRTIYFKDIPFIRIIVTVLLLFLLSSGLQRSYVDRSNTHKHWQAEITSDYEPTDPDTGSRYQRVIIEDFNNFTGIDQSNTSCGVDTREGRASISSGFLFPGDGMILKLEPTGAYRGDNTCTQVCDTTSSGDGSGKFVWQWYSGGGGWRQNTISGVKFMRGNAELCSAIPQNPRGPGNCIPFGSGGGYGPHQGFVYKNMDSFSLQNGDQVWFDVTRANDADCIYNMYLGHTTQNGGRDIDGNGYTQICYAANGGRGSAQRGDWMLRFEVSGVAGSENAELGYLQSIPLYTERFTIGAARMTWFEHKPQGTNIVYNMTVDGKNWVTMQNHTNYVFKDRGSRLMWNATLTTGNNEITPYIDRVIIEYDLVSDPEPFAPSSVQWQGNSTPTLKWNFTDPDKGDHQSDFIVEIFEDPEMNNLVYNSSWVNSTDSEHTVGEELEDGEYFWRVKTKDVYHAWSNFSSLKKIMIDITQPLGNITIEEGALTVNEQLVNLKINASDNGSGIADMQVIGDDGEMYPWEEYKTEKRIALSLTDCLKKIEVRFMDHAGIISERFNDTIYLDLRGPGDVNVTSPTHPDPEMYYNSTLPVFSWDPPVESAGIKGYSYMVDGSPLTQPPKVLYTSNSQLTGTFDGEFSGLGQGTWYFHISTSDIYDQWGNTSHFRFNIDSAAPIIYELSPEKGKWVNETTIRTSVVYEDVDGFGLDTDNIQYAYRKSGETGFSQWTSERMEFEVLKEGTGENPEKVQAWVDLELSEGSENAVKWRITDLAGNGPVSSEMLVLKVDLTPVVFFAPVPEEDMISNENYVSCGISISDIGGSGVDGKTVEYSISKYGGDDIYFQNWTALNSNMVKENMDVFLDIEFEPGRNNYIKWRARDAVGNPFSISDAYRIWVNSPPIPVIERPYEDETFEVNAVISLNASGSTDNEDDQLYYSWVIKGKSSKKVFFKGSGMEVETALANEGKYIVYLYVNDGHGFNESSKVNIEVIPKTPRIDDPADIREVLDSDGDSLPDWWEIENGMDPNNPNDAGPDQIQEYEKEHEESKKGSTTGKDLLSRYWWLLIIIGSIVLIMIIGLIVLARRRRKKKKRKVPVPQFPAERPYAAGSRDFNRPQYAAGPHSYQSKGQYPMVARSGWSQGGMHPTVPGTMRPGVNGYLPDPQQQRPALPMQTQTSFAQSSVSSGPQSWSPQGQAQPQYLSVPGPQQALPGYTLPPISTDQGMQDLNRMALPPAPEVDSGQLFTGQAETPQPAAQAFAPASSNSLFAPEPFPVETASPPLPEPQMSVPDLFAIPEPPTSAVTGTPSIDDLFDTATLPPLPPTEPPSPPPAADEATPQAQSVQCHSCEAMNQITTTERPTVITCPVCNAQGYIGE
ncbi:MAG: hypothetical protein QGH39_02795 [Candidatus Thermoplasmatota archaeon]|nr:hypothetical protein [Candidatus Thermoplasmatota archaeon]